MARFARGLRNLVYVSVLVTPLTFIVDEGTVVFLVFWVTLLALDRGMFAFEGVSGQVMVEGDALCQCFP